MSYDGSTKVGDAVVGLYGLTRTNVKKLTPLMTEAREALNLGNGKRLTTEQKKAIYQYHCDKLNKATPTYTQTDAVDYVESISQPVNATVEDVSQDSVEHDSQAVNVPVENITHSNSDDVEHITQTAIKHVEDVSQPVNTTVEDNSRHYGENKHVRLAFYTNIDGIKKRQVIALQGFMVNALMVAIGATDKADVPRWLNSQDSIVGDKPLTWQVQRLIVQALLTKAK
ncbi:MAG: hypothetical protein QX198_17200 [Methylococcaceae bacterium]